MELCTIKLSSYDCVEENQTVIDLLENNWRLITAFYNPFSGECFYIFGRG